MRWAICSEIHDLEAATVGVGVINGPGRQIRLRPLNRGRFLLLQFEANPLQTQGIGPKARGFQAWLVGYMYKNVEGDTFNGITASGVGNFHNFMGAKLDLSWAKGPDRLGSHPESFTYMGGVQFKDNRTQGAKFRPFGHLLLGGETQSFAGISDSAFTMAIGGGLDYRVNQRYSIRLIQADYQPAFPGNGIADQARFSFGMVFH